MPLNAYGVLATFTAAWTLIGAAIGRFVGPPRRLALVAPVQRAVLAGRRPSGAP